MNLALFLNQDTNAHIEAFAKRASELQESIVNGALVVVHDKSITQKRVNEVVADLRHKFKVVNAVPVHVNNSASPDTKIASMFASFLLGVYTTYPGAWLIVDDFALPTTPNFLTLVELQHNAGGKGLTGRFTKGRGWLVPQGPVTISLPSNKLKFLRFSSSESWRERGKYHFARSGFCEIEPANYLFTISEKHPNPVRDEPKVSAAAPLTRSSVPLPFVAPAAIEVEEVREEAEAVEQEIPSAVESAVEDVVAGERDLSLFTNQELHAEACKVSGRKIHPATGRVKLLDIINESKEVEA